MIYIYFFLSRQIILSIIYVIEDALRRMIGFFYFDADVITTDPSFKLERLIQHVNDKMHCTDHQWRNTFHNPCHVIAQLSPSTINTGIVSFRHSRILFVIGWH